MGNFSNNTTCSLAHLNSMWDHHCWSSHSFISIQP